MISRCPGAAVRTCRDRQLEGAGGGPGPSRPPARASSATPKPGCLSQGHGWQRRRADRGEQSSAGPGLRSQHQSPAQRPSPSPSPPAGLGLGGGERDQPSVSSCPPEVRITAEVYSPQIQNFQHQKSLSRLVRWQKRVCPIKVTDCPALGLWTHPCVWLRVGMGSRSTRTRSPTPHTLCHLPKVKTLRGPPSAESYRLHEMHTSPHLERPPLKTAGQSVPSFTHS